MAEIKWCGRVTGLSYVSECILPGAGARSSLGHVVGYKMPPALKEQGDLCTRADVGKLWPTGQIRPFRLFNLARPTFSKNLIHFPFSMRVSTIDGALQTHRP